MNVEIEQGRSRDQLRLETARLVLRDWDVADVSDLIDGLNDMNVSKWLAYVPYPYTELDANQWVQHCTKNSQNTQDRVNYEFEIELKSEHKVIGGVSLVRVNRVHGTAGGGIWLSAKYQGQGYGTEAFGEKIRFAFEDLGLRRLENGLFKGNSSSLSMQKQFGYQLEGERRKAFKCMADGELKDECVMGLLKEEWQK